MLHLAYLVRPREVPGRLFVPGTFRQVGKAPSVSAEPSASFNPESIEQNLPVSSQCH